MTGGLSELLALLQDDEKGAYVYVVREGKAKRLDVKTGYETADAIEVIEGISPDDDLVVEGQDTLTDDAEIRLVEAE